MRWPEDLLAELDAAVARDGGSRTEWVLAAARDLLIDRRPIPRGSATKAHRAVQKAIKAGELVPPRDCACADCGKSAAFYHHESYREDDRLDVVPLCTPCHAKRHNAKTPHRGLHLPRAVDDVLMAEAARRGLTLNQAVAAAVAAWLAPGPKSPAPAQRSRQPLHREQVTPIPKATKGAKK